MVRERVVNWILRKRWVRWRADRVYPVGMVHLHHRQRRPRCRRAGGRCALCIGGQLAWLARCVPCIGVSLLGWLGVAGATYHDCRPGTDEHQDHDDGNERYLPAWEAGRGVALWLGGRGVNEEDVWHKSRVAQLPSPATPQL